MFRKTLGKTSTRALGLVRCRLTIENSCFTLKMTSGWMFSCSPERFLNKYIVYCRAKYFHDFCSSLTLEFMMCKFCVTIFLSQFPGGLSLHIGPVTTVSDKFRCSWPNLIFKIAVPNLLNNFPRKHLWYSHSCDKVAVWLFRTNILYYNDSSEGVS